MDNQQQMDVLLRGKINYYCREHFYHGMQRSAVEALKVYPGDDVYKFYYCVSLIFQGKVQEGIRELDSLQENPDVTLGSLLALIYAHRRCKVVDKETVAVLDSKLKNCRKHTTEKALYYGGWFLFQCGRVDKSKEYVDRMIKVAPEFQQGMVLKGWLDLFLSKDNRNKQILHYFDTAKANDVDSLFGKAKYFEQKANYNGALEILNQAVVTFPNYAPFLIERMKIQLALKEWDQMADSAVRVLAVDKTCVEPIRYLALNVMCKEANNEQAAAKLAELTKAIDQYEPQNSVLYYETAQVFGRMCGRNPMILQHTLLMAERAANLDPSNAEYITEVGYQYLLQSKVRDATKKYHAATKLDQSSVRALTGIIMCQLEMEQLDIAEQQLEFLKELQQSIGTSAEVMYLNSVLSYKRNKSADDVLSLLNQSIDIHFSKLKGLSLSLQYLTAMNPDFLVLVVKDYLKYSPSQPVSHGQPVVPSLSRSLAILETVCRACPGLLEALYLMAKIKFLCGDHSAAATILNRCLEQQQSFGDAHLLMAEIHLLKGNYQQASHSLEVGLSHNFEVRERPAYSLIKARILKKQNQYEECIQTLMNAMIHAGIKPGSGTRRKPKFEVTTREKIDLYLELVESHRLLNQQHEAAKIMQDALNEFQGTPEEVRVLIANSDLAVSRGDVELALSMLRNIGSDQQFYIEAREKMAEIYLHKRKDRRLYASCYREIVEKFPIPQSFLLLGDAYMSIQEPERAIEVYEQALKKNPRDSMLAKKIGQALIKTHNYGKAINYYEAAIKSGNQNFLRYDLAHLLMKLKQFEKSQKVLNIALEQENQGNDLSSMMNRTKYLVLLCQVYQSAGHSDQILKTLSLAKDMQTRVMKRVFTEQPESVDEQRNAAISICRQMAEYCIELRDFDTAITHYNEALSYRENDCDITLSLCRLYLTLNNLDSCHVLCSKILATEVDNDAANVMMADLMFRKNDYQSALYHFQHLLENKPDNYVALSKIIEALRRIGKLDQVPPLLSKVEDYNSRSVLESGYNFCYGLYEWYSQNPSAALKYFNKARRDSTWGENATYNMIEICINPDNDTLGGETFESVDAELSRQDDSGDGKEIAIRTAEKLFKDLKTTPGGINHKILSNFIILAKKQKNHAERALQELMQTVAEERNRDHIGAILGIATAHMILKQTPKARNQLKRIAKNAWNFEDAEYLERCWLLLADIYIQSAKYDMSLELLKKVLHHNKSCSKAYEYKGFIMEKEQSYRDAADSYEIAWMFSKKSNPVIGYKLGFNYMKSKRYLDAIDVCHEVLDKFPKYPKIQKDILDKSRSHLRV